MTTINITLNAPELTSAINMLLEALTNKPAPVLEVVKPTAATVEPAVTSVIQAPVNPVPVAVAPAPVNPVPIASAPSYTLDMLARAGAILAQAGKMDQAMALLTKYGIATVSQLKPEQYGAFAAELRALGAQL